MFYRPSLRYAVEAVQQFSPNVVGFQMTTEERRWCIVGCYLAPNDTSTIESFVAALKERPWGSEMLVAGYLNFNMVYPEGDQREEEIVAVLTTTGLEDKSAHFLPQRRPWCRYGRTCRKVW